MIPTTLAYRDDAEGAAIRLADLVTRRTRDDRALAGAQRAHGRRTARIAAGTVGVVAAAALASVTAAAQLAHVPLPRGTSTAVLLAAWPAMALAYAAGRVDLWRRLGRAIAPAPRARDLHAEIARLEQEVPVARTRARASSIERASAALPLIATALLGPLTLHAIVYGVASNDLMNHFDTWIGLSLAIVGHAHLVFAWMGHRYAARLRSATSDEIRRTWLRQALKAYGYTVLASAIPGAIFILLPPILTALTGLFLASLAYCVVSAAIVTERGLLGEEA